MEKSLTIGQLAKVCNVSTDTLRYYEKMGLLKPDTRTDTNYRKYTSDAMKVVRFIRGAKSLNFTLEEIRQMLSLNGMDKATCANMLARTENKIKEAESRIQELLEIKRVLGKLAKSCPGDDSPLSCCPILDHIKNKAGIVILLAAMLFSVCSTAQAKPISYVGGTMAMIENDETGRTLSLDYTLSPNYAIGLYAKKEHGGKEFETIGPQLNTLIKRWNLPEGQGNIFNMTGAGVSHYHGESEASAWTSFLGDYETRRIFTSYEARFMYADTIEQSVWHRARVGFAPYLANYDGVHTWLMLQVDDHPAKEDSIVVTPLVRFFYGTTLAEVGVNNNGNGMFNLVLQF